MQENSVLHIKVIEIWARWRIQFWVLTSRKAMVSVPLISVKPRVYFEDTCRGNLKIQLHIKPVMDTTITCTLEDLQHISNKNIGSFCSNSLWFCEIRQRPRTIVLGKTGGKVLIFIPLWSFCTAQSVQKGCKARELGNWGLSRLLDCEFAP